MAIQELQALSIESINSAPTTFSRTGVLNADWNERLIAIQGHRGSGKTTLLLQALAAKTIPGNGIYVSLDNLFFQSRTLFETVRELYQDGYNLIVLDEIHKYLNWSVEIKNLYDRYKELRIIFTGSSALEIYKASADLSRRAVSFDLPVMSLREFIVLETGISLEPIPLNKILTDHTSLALALNKKLRNPLKYFKMYLEYGCYPFYKEGMTHYKSKLMRTTNLVLETDIAAVTNIPYNSIYKMKKLLAFIAQSVPFKPNVTQLAEKIEAKRETTLQYLDYLQRAGIVRLLATSGKSMGPMSKPEKIYLDNPNLAYALSIETPNTGNIRETFFLSQVSRGNRITASPTGDFLVNEKITFEVGGKNKQGKQVKALKNSYIIKDDLLSGSKNEIPLWLFGFLY